MRQFCPGYCKSAWLPIATVLLTLLGTVAAWGQDHGCRRLAYLPGTEHRSGVDHDYLVIVYDARRDATSWYDYLGGAGASDGSPIKRNASFLPITYAKEKIAVHVCGLHFGDSLTVTNNPSGLTFENAIDIRGNTAAATAPSLSATADLLQTSGLTGEEAQQSGLGFSATLSAMTSTGITLTGINPASFSSGQNGPTYSDATITVSPWELAEATHANSATAQALIRAVDAQIGSPGNPGSIRALESEAEGLEEEISRKSDSASDLSQNPAAFDDELTRVQNFVGELNDLSMTLASQSFGARAVTLNANYSMIQGDLETIRKIIESDKRDQCNEPAAQVPKTCSCSGQSKTSADQCAKTSACQVTQTLSTGAAPDSQTCRYWELRSFKKFRDEYYRDLRKVHGGDEVVTAAQVFAEIDALRKHLSRLDRRSAEIFGAMNRWYSSSRVENTDILSPAASNTIERISIVVQHTYVPFTIGGATASSSSSTATAGPGAATASASSGGGASISTPAHTVKTVLVEVHRRANFNLVGGAMVIRVPSKTYSLIQAVPSSQGTVSCGTGTPISLPSSTPPTYDCITIAQSTDWQVTGMAGIDWFYVPRDYFPRGGAFGWRKSNLWPVPMVATSVTSLGNAFGGANWEPVNGLDLFIGLASANQADLPTGYSTNTPYVSGTFQTNATAPPTVTHVHTGLTFGVGFDLSVFTSFFGKQTGTLVQ